ncbi:probable glucose 1-dehydrogenase [Thermoplasma acidophilum]|uniref:Probable glucose 1-dehydrogenase n=1 Tax=Thermoplasma acidophilum (strain ATCC 25905 / DSM 1728 / JCM 9062 / NBRC 15155 / AMRC-C165) TaxID=273075 RepID=Q9HLN6_THEAC|nr:SDR family oxidoreductase [Thermoplasma acidophilum]CAC11337.1 probable glucose 1-dehydrogenase [Thermoplasma acidophilum]
MDENRGSRIAINLTGKIALVTGSSSGLGAAIAKYMARAGAKVAVHYRSGKDRADAIVDEIKNDGGFAMAFYGDVSKKEDVQKLFSEIDSKLGTVDILVNNAGIDGKRELVGEDDPDDWEKVIEVNLMGPYYCAREAVKRMKPKKSGVIINITSVHEYVPWSGYTAYSSAKAGLSMFTKALAQELSDYNIRVVAIAPGAIKTPINKDVWGNPESLKDLLNKIAMPRLGEVDDIGQAAVFLASDLASYITGTTLLVDGGMALYPDFKHGG